MLVLREVAEGLMVYLTVGLHSSSGIDSRDLILDRAKPAAHGVLLVSSLVELRH